jgi:hypothetical protein
VGSVGLDELEARSIDDIALSLSNWPEAYRPPTAPLRCAHTELDTGFKPPSNLHQAPLETTRTTGTT